MKFAREMTSGAISAGVSALASRHLSREDSETLLLLGTGSESLFAPRELTFALARRGIGLEAMSTAAAARTFNVLAGEGRRIAAVLYL